MKFRASTAVASAILLAGFLPTLHLSAAGGKAAAKSTVDFNRDIRPILSDTCFACHGPDEHARKAKLRFDLKEEAFKPAKSGEVAIVPGDPGKSPLVARILSKDEDEVMPPVNQLAQPPARRSGELRQSVASCWGVPPTQAPKNS